MKHFCHQLDYNFIQFLKKSFDIKGRILAAGRPLLGILSNMHNDLHTSPGKPSRKLAVSFIPSQIQQLSAQQEEVLEKFLGCDVEKCIAMESSVPDCLQEVLNS